MTEQVKFDSKFNVAELQVWLMKNGFSEDTAKSCKGKDIRTCQC